jgi:hypothetical protein
MKTGSWKVFFAILAATILVSWGTGMLIVRGTLPRWAMIVVNPPFGAVYTWTESLWEKTSYIYNGQIVDEGLVMGAQVLAILAQAILFYGAWWLWKQARQRRG